MSKGQFGNITGFGTNVGGTHTFIPNKEWYYRENPSSELVGPMSFREAEHGARKLSESEEHSGLSELVTYVGNRKGDPIQPPKLFVVYMFIRGKRALGGRTAQYHSDRGLPPTT